MVVTEFMKSHFWGDVTKKHKIGMKPIKINPNSDLTGGIDWTFNFQVIPPIDSRQKLEFEGFVKDFISIFD